MEDIFEQFDEDLSGALDFKEFKRAASSHKDLLSLFFDPKAFSFNSAHAAAGGAPSKPAAKECWEGVDCTRAECHFSHPKGRKAFGGATGGKAKKDAAGGIAKKDENCYWGADCTKSDCKFKHPGGKKGHGGGASGEHWGKKKGGGGGDHGGKKGGGGDGGALLHWGAAK